MKFLYLVVKHYLLLFLDSLAIFGKLLNMDFNNFKFNWLNLVLWSILHNLFIFHLLLISLNLQYTQQN